MGRSQLPGLSCMGDRRTDQRRGLVESRLRNVGTGKTRAVAVERWLAGELARLPGTHLLVIHADFKRLLLTTMLDDST